MRAARWLPLFALLLLTLLLTWPTIATLSSRVVDRQDPLLNAWIMAWEARQSLVDPRQLFDANIFYPQANTLAFSELLLSSSALVMPIQWLTGDAVLAYNLAFLLSFLTTAIGGYLLALYLTGKRGPALVAAVALAWAPYRLAHLSQVQLLAFGWLPLALIYLDRLLRGRRPAQASVLLTLFLLLQALASFYAALFSALCCLIYGIGWLVARRRLAWHSVVGLGVVALAATLLMLPFVRPYFEVQRTLGAGWTLAQNAQFSASLQAYAYAPASSPLWGHLSERLYYTYGPCCPPDALFPTVTVVLLAVLALWRGRGGRRWIWLAIAAAAFLLSLGPVLHVRAGVPTPVALPYGWLWAHLPGFDAIRAPVRWAVLVTLALAMLAAVGLSRLPRWAWGVALLLLLAEVAPVPLRTVSLPPPSPSQAWLDLQPPTVILELPLVAARPVEPAPPDQPRLAWERSRLLEAQLGSTRHWHSTPDGYTGYIPTRHGDFAREIAAFPSPRSIALLRGLGVRYLVLHEADATAEQLAAWDEAPLPEVTRIGTDRILALEPTRAPAPIATLPLSRLTLDHHAVPLLLQAAGDPYVPVAGSPAALTVRWTPASGNRASSHQQSLFAPWPMVVEGEALMTLPAAPPAPGVWQLTVEGRFPGGEPLRAERRVTVSDGAAEQPLPVQVRAMQLADDELTLEWEAFGFLERHYRAIVRLYAADGSLLGQLEGAPSDALETIAWLPGVAYPKRWPLEGIQAAQVARVELTWYDPERADPILLLWDGSRFDRALEPLR